MSSTSDYVNDVFKQRSEDAAAMLEAYQNNQEWEGYDAGEALADLPLSVQRKVLVTITLGVGGPGDWIDVVCSTNSYQQVSIESATYTAVWGSDKQVTQLQDTDALWQLAEHYIEGMEA